MSMTMLRPRIALCAALLAAFCLPVAAQEKDELWDITMKMDIAGMPMSIPAHTSRMCVENGAKEDRFVPHQSECKNVESKRTGNKYTFKMVCEGKDKMTGTGEVTFGDGTYDGKTRMTGTMEGQPVSMTQAYSGKRVGACTAPPKAK